MSEFGREGREREGGRTEEGETFFGAFGVNGGVRFVGEYL